MKKRNLAAVLTAAMVMSLGTGVVTGRAEESPVSGPTEMTFIFADGDTTFKAYMNDIVARFNETYEDITITIEPGDGGAYSDFLKTKDAVGEFPDMMEMRDTAVYVRAGKLAPFSDELKSLFVNTMEFDGEVYTAPMAQENTDGIYYDIDYFAEKGYEVPTTWDEFLALCQQIKDDGEKAPLVVGGQDIWHLGFWFNKIYQDDVIEADADFIAHCYEGTKTFDDETFKQVLTDITELAQYWQDGWASTPDAQITTFFVNDMAAMMFSGTHMISQIREAAPDMNLGWFPVYDREGTLNLVGGAGVGGLALSAEAAEDPNKAAAFEAFIKFFFAPENYKEYCEVMNCIPTTVDQPELDVDSCMQSVIEALNGADDLSPMWNGMSGENELPPDFRNFTYKTTIEVIQGTQTVDEAVAEIQKTWDVAAASFNPVTGVGLE